ncbi:MAG: glutaminase A [Candidatus Methylacidiphilales bacterium]|nr:glutaminase A [Candidatus Methylacidiphilales bacterium]
MSSKNSFPERPAKPSATSISSPIQETIEALHRQFCDLDEGEVATYIPELGKADPSWFGICLVTADGAVYEAGNTTQEFTIQSISKPFSYGMALEDNSRVEVLKKIWVEPTGEAFNSISLQPGTGRPMNPMINAGAIATTGLVEGKTSAQKMRRILDSLSRFAGRSLSVDQTVYQSENETGHRNRAIAHMLRNFDILTEDPTPALEAYFQQCSVLVNCRDLGVMAATLANGGSNPITGQRAVSADYVESMLSVMGSCGMYDAAGEWIYNVGMPAKSGVAGGIVAVLPGQLGIGVFSPRLDPRGNSVRGIAVCRELSHMFDLHMFKIPRVARTSVRRVIHPDQNGSNRLRTESESRVLKAHGHQIALVELQGELLFSGAESVTRAVLDVIKDSPHLLLDFRHVLRMDLVAARMLTRLLGNILLGNLPVILTGTRHLAILESVFRKEAPEAVRDKILWIQEADYALETAENRLLADLSATWSADERVALGDCELLLGSHPDDLKIFEKLLISSKVASGTALIQPGETGDDLYFLLRGKVSAWVPDGEGGETRVSTFSSGMAFGEMALIDRSPRSAKVVSDTEVELQRLRAVDFDGLEVSCPRLYALILRNLTRLLSGRLRKANIGRSVLAR